MRMGLREANQHFSKIVRVVKGGREVVLTERGKPIAVVRPIRRGFTREAVLQELEAEGFLRRALRRDPMPPWRPIRIKGVPLSETIREERDRA